MTHFSLGKQRDFFDIRNAALATQIMNTHRMSTVYYLPGYGGQLGKGLGIALSERGYDVYGRETRGDFKELTFQQKLDAISDDIQTHFWREDARVIANSFGAYLFLHAQAQMPPFIGRLLLLSPIVGDFNTEDASVGFVPPRAEVLLALSQTKRFPRPSNVEIHVGTDDWQSNPINVHAFADPMSINVTLVHGRGHDLGKDYVGPLLDAWLT